MTLLLTILERLLSMSLTAAFVAVVVLLLRQVLKRKAPRQIICLLWLVVFARLLIPVTVETPFSLVPPELGDFVYEQVEEAAEEPAPDENVTPQAPVLTPSVQTPVTQSPTVTQPPVSTVPSVTPSVSIPPQSAPTVPPMVEDAPVEEPAVPETPVEPALSGWLYALPVVWLAGVFAMLVYGVASYLIMRRRVYAAVCCADGVWEHHNLRAPFILGLFRPKIYLPMGISGQPRRFILLHERAHLRRGDHIVKPICWLALAIHWFNPLAWVAFLLLSRDIETACDESVIRQLGSEVKADYSATLLALATNSRFPSPSPLSFGEGDAKVRIKNVLNFRKPALWVTIIAVVVVIVAAVCLLTNPVTPGSTMPEWAEELEAGGVESVIVSVWRRGGQETTEPASQETLEELIAILNAIPEEEFEGVLDTMGAEVTMEEWLKQADFGEIVSEDGTVRISILRSDSEHHGVLLYQEGQVYLSVLTGYSEVDGASIISSFRWRVDHAELTDFMRALAVTLDKEPESHQSTPAVLRHQTGNNDLCLDLDGDGVAERIVMEFTEIGGGNFYDILKVLDENGAVTATLDTYSFVPSSRPVDAAVTVNYTNYNRVVVELGGVRGEIPVDGSAYVPGTGLSVGGRAFTDHSLLWDGTDLYLRVNCYIKISDDNTLGYTEVGEVEFLYRLTYADGSFGSQLISIDPPVEGKFRWPADLLGDEDTGYFEARMTLQDIYPHGSAYLYTDADGNLILSDRGSIGPVMVNGGAVNLNELGVEEITAEIYFIAYTQELERYVTIDVRGRTQAILTANLYWYEQEGVWSNTYPTSPNALRTLSLELDNYMTDTVFGTPPVQLGGSPVVIKMDLPGTISNQGGDLVIYREDGTPGGIRGGIQLVKVDEDFIMDESVAQTMQMISSGGVYVENIAQGKTVIPFETKTGYDAVLYTESYDDASGETPDFLYAYVRISPEYVLNLYLSGEEYLERYQDIIYSIKVLDGVTYDTGNMRELASLPEYDLHIYRHNDLFAWFVEMGGYQTPIDTVVDTFITDVQFIPGDRDGDTNPEVVVIYPIGSGTGLSVDGLMACRVYGGAVEAQIHDWSDLAARFNANNFFTYDAEGNVLYLTYNGVTAWTELSGYMRDVDWSKYGTSTVITGEQVSYSANEDGTVTLTFAPALVGYTPMSQYFDIRVECTLRHTGSRWELVDGLHLVGENLMEGGLSADDPASPEMLGSLFLSALENGMTVFLPEIARDPTVTLRGLLEMLDPDMEVTKMAAIDLDGDGVKEMLLRLETDSPYGTLILHYDNAAGQVYGYTLWLRSFDQVKTDGTFLYSNTSAEGGIARLSFTSYGHDMEEITYSEYIDDVGYFYVDGRQTTEAAFNSAVAAQQEKPGVTWTEYTETNAEIFIREHFAADYDLSALTQLDALPDEGAILYADAVGRMVLQAGEYIGPISNEVWPVTATGFSVSLTKTESGRIALRCRNQKTSGIDVNIPVTWSVEAGAWVRSVEPVDNGSKRLPTDLVTPDTIPADPEEYYLVAALPENHIYLYARNYGQDSMLAWENFSWPMEGRAAHTSYFFLPEMALLDENHVAVVSHADKGTGVSRYELVVYEFAEEYQVDSSFYTGMRDYVYDWQPVAEAFNRNNTIVYRAYDNSITMTYNGKTYTSSSWNLGQYYDLENGFTGAAIADGEQVEFQVNDDGTISVRLGLTLAGSGEGRFHEDDLFWYSDADRYYPMGDIGFSLAWTIRFADGGFEVVDGSLYFPGTNGPSDFSGYEVREEYPGLYFRTATDPISGITWQTAYTFVDGEARLVAKLAPYPENLFVGADGVETDYDDEPVMAWVLWDQALIDASMACDYYGFLGSLPHDRTTPYGSRYQFAGQVDNIVLYSLSDLSYGSATLIREGTDLQIVPYPSVGFHGDSPDLLWQDLDGDSRKELAVICNGAATGTHQYIDALTVYEWDGGQWVAHKHDLTAAIDTAAENMDWSIDDDGVLTVNALGLTAEYSLPTYLQENWDELMPNGYEASLEPSYVYEYSAIDGKLTLAIRFSLMPGAGNLAMCYDVFEFIYEVEYNGAGAYTDSPMTIRLRDGW